MLSTSPSSASTQQQIQQATPEANPLDVSFSNPVDVEAAGRRQFVGDVRQEVAGRFTVAGRSEESTSVSEGQSRTTKGVSSVSLNEAVNVAGQEAYNAVYERLSQMGVDADTKMEVAMLAKQHAEYVAQGKSGSINETLEQTNRQTQLDDQLRKILEEETDKVLKGQGISQPIDQPIDLNTDQLTDLEKQQLGLVTAQNLDPYAELQGLRTSAQQEQQLAALLGSTGTERAELFASAQEPLSISEEIASVQKDDDRVQALYGQLRSFVALYGEREALTTT